MRFAAMKAVHFGERVGHCLLEISVRLAEVGPVVVDDR
jgi:hypothetical protein